MLRWPRPLRVHHDHDLVKQGPQGPVTLGELFSQLHIDVSGLTVNDLDVQADSSLWERFDYFNAKYRPMGNAPAATASSSW